VPLLRSPREDYGTGLPSKKKPRPEQDGASVLEISEMREMANPH
jgi:hypothetical protein